MAQIIISTGGVNFDYEVIDVIFVIAGTAAGFLSEIDPNAAFNGVKVQLKEKCEALGGDAVVFCQFEYRSALANGMLGPKQALEIFAYGTVVVRKR